MSSSVRRILKRGGQKFQKIWEEQRSESEIVPLKFSPIFRPKSGEEQKKRSSLKFSPIFRPNTGEEQKQGPPKYAPACDCDIISKAKGREVQENSSYLCSEVFTKQN